MPLSFEAVTDEYATAVSQISPAGSMQVNPIQIVHKSSPAHAFLSGTLHICAN
jgi:hypothetical protein